jgi:hypothetical protein
VAGIVILEPPIYELLDFEHPWADKTWKLCSVSLAAQLATAPLSMVYFHHFPLYFLPANLLIIPLSSLIMYWGLGSLALSFIPLIDNALFYCLACLVKIMTGMTTFIASLPWSDSGLILLDNYQSLLLYLSLLAAAAFLAIKRFIFLWFCLLAIFFYCGYTTISPYITQGKTYLVVHNIQGKSAISLIRNNSMDTWMFGAFREQKESRPVQLEYLIINRKITHVSQSKRDIDAISGKEGHQPALTETLKFDGKCYLVLTDSTHAYSLKTLRGIESIITFSGPPPGMDTACLPDGLRLVIIGNSVSKQGNKKWTALCNELQINCFDIKKRGAFVLEACGSP